MTLDAVQAPRAVSLAARLRQETERLWRLLLERYTGRNGLLNYFVDPFAGRSLRLANAIKDFGDSLQYAVYAARLLNQPALERWALSQGQIASRLFQTPAGYFLTDDSTETLRPPLPWGYFKLEDNSDLLMGMVSAYRQSPSPEWRPIIERLTAFVDSLSRGRRHPNAFILLGPLRLPLPFRFPDGLFVEELVNWGHLSGDPRWWEAAERLSASWENSAYYRRTGFYPIVASSGKEQGWKEFALLDSAGLARLAPGLARRFRSSVFIKMNTNTVSGDLALFKATGSEPAKARVRRWLARARQELFREDGYFYGRWDLLSGKASHGGYPLADNHHLLNIFEDAAWILGDSEYLGVAQKNAAFWMGQVTPLGLFPELYKPGYERAAVLDNQVDYIVTLLKLHELTGQPLYLDRACRSTEALLEHFHAPFGLKWCIHADTGQNMKPAICTKFLSLFTKLTLLLHEVLSGKKILQDPLLFDLSRDR